MAKVHDRILEVNCTLVAAADTIQIDSLKYYRDRGELDAAVAYSLGYTPTTAQTSPAEVTLGDLLPPPTIIRFKFANF